MLKGTGTDGHPFLIQFENAGKAQVQQRCSVNPDMKTNTYTGAVLDTNRRQSWERELFGREGKQEHIVCTSLLKKLFSETLSTDRTGLQPRTSFPTQIIRVAVVKPENQVFDRPSLKSISFNTDVPKLSSVTDIILPVFGFRCCSQSA